MRDRKNDNAGVLASVAVAFALTHAFMFLLCWIGSWPKQWYQFPLQFFVGCFLLFFAAVFVGGVMSLTKDIKDE